MLHVSAEELVAIASLSNSVHLTFFGICAGAAISFAIVLSTTSITTASAFAAYVALAAVSMLGTLYFGVRARTDYRRAQEKLGAILQGSPVGR